MGGAGSIGYKQAKVETVAKTPGHAHADARGVADAPSTTGAGDAASSGQVCWAYHPCQSDHANQFAPLSSAVVRANVQFFPAGVVASNALHMRSSATAGTGGAAAANDDIGDGKEGRKPIFTLSDFAQLISTMISAEVEELVVAYRTSLSKEQPNARMRNVDLFKGIASVFNDTPKQFILTMIVRTAGPWT